MAAPEKPASGTAVSEAEIAVHWKEEEVYKPSKKFIDQANLTDPKVRERFNEKNFPDCFVDYAEMLTWYQRWNKVLDTSDPPFWKWFVGGKLNVSYNCVDRHLAKYKNKAAIIFVPEPENEAPAVSQLYRRALEYVRSEFTERLWQAFWLTAIEERLPADLAAQLGMTPAAIRQAKSRVLRRLKQELGELLA